MKQRILVILIAFYTCFAFAENDDVDQKFQALEKRIETLTQQVAAFQQTASIQLDVIRKQKGDQGNKGDKGDLGPVGPQGSPGVKGEKGDKGDGGTNGKDGMNGTNGTNGKNGNKGDKGERGDKGDSAACQLVAVGGWRIEGDEAFDGVADTRRMEFSSQEMRCPEGYSMQGNSFLVQLAPTGFDNIALCCR